MSNTKYRIYISIKTITMCLPLKILLTRSLNLLTTAQSLDMTLSYVVTAKPVITTGSIITAF